MLGRGAQARFPGIGSQARAGNFAWEPALPGNACLRTCSCELCSCLEPCLETVPGTLLGNRFWEPYLQAVPKNLTVLGSFLQGSQARVPETVAKQGSQEQVPRQGSQEQVSKKGCNKRLPRIGSQARFLGTGFQARFARPGSQARFARTGSQARAPRTMPQVPKQGFQEQVSLQGSKVT